MRTTIRDVVQPRHPVFREMSFPRRFAAWWIDMPYRRRDWWEMALFAPGEGWLRWGWGERMEYENLGEGLYNPEYWRVGPPLRRTWEQIGWILNVPRLMLREHLSWEEVAPDFSCLRSDPERRRELWRAR